MLLLEVREQNEEVRSGGVNCKENIMFCMTILILEIVFNGEIP